MISLNWSGVEGDIGAMMKRFGELPRHIAKKHLQAAMKRALRMGIPVLKRNTPKSATRRGRGKSTRSAAGGPARGSGNSKKERSGALRRSVITKSRYIGRNRDGVVIGALGYKAGPESRKAIWLEFGTKKGIEPRKMIEKTMQEYDGPVKAILLTEMANALEKAAKELEGQYNQGYQGN